MRIKYNAPTTLTFAFFCTLTVAIDQFLLHGFIRAFFTVPSALQFNILKPLDYLRMFTHIAGHADWNHLLSNLAYILLLGPMLEETYGSFTMFLMIVVTGFVTGVLNACFFPHPLLGASGVVFMMILLASFTNHGKNDVPLTFILIVILYLGREFLNAFRGDDISQFAHLAGGLCGSLFGFFRPRPAPRRTAAPKINAAANAAAPADLPVQTPPIMQAGAKKAPPARIQTKPSKTATPAAAQPKKPSASLKSTSPQKASSEQSRSAQPAKRKTAPEARRPAEPKDVRKRETSSGDASSRNAGKTRKTQSGGN